jgi:arabinogalactan endo-1,4-beta-galactosidase
MKIFQLLAAATVLAVPVLANAAIVKGADVSWLSEMENSGYRFYNDAGSQQDLLQILKAHDMSAVRLRVWVNPSGGYYNGINDVLSKALRAKQAGMKVMIDFHYSDSWADPGKQYKPAAWSNLSFQQLMDTVWAYTRSSLITLRDAGVTPDWVQVGNETNNGMLWPDGQASSNMRNYAWLTATGYNAVKDVFPSTPVIVHLANCHDNANFRWIFDGLKANGGKFDIIGASSYPLHASGHTWQSANVACLWNLNDMVSRYGAPVMVTEVGVPWDHAQGKSIVSDLISKVAAVNSGKGLGVFYWEPQAYGGWQGYTLGAFGSNGRPTATLDAFLSNGGGTTRLQSRKSGKCIDVPGLNQSSGTGLVQYSCGSGWNQQWSTESLGNGYWRLKVLHSGQCMNLASQSTSNSIRVVQSSCGSGNSQQWTKEDMGNGYYRLKNRYSGKCADVTGASTADNATVIQYSCGSATNQQWINN